jgi:3-oxoacyl-[acyl-carrier-protein] synthase-3
MGIRIAGVAVSVPENVSGMDDLITKFGETTSLKIQKATGVKERHVVVGSMKTMELALCSAKHALDSSGISPKDLDGIILVSQTPEYKLPATACILQDKLGIPKSSMAFDVNLGCSGYPYGLILANSLIESGLLKKVLMVIGDITSSTAAPDDQSTFPLFADAFSSTIVEKSEGKSDLLGISYGTDGSGKDFLINPIGAVRYRNLDEFTKSKASELFPAMKYPEYTYMDGNEIFVFCLKTIPKTIEEAISNSSVSLDNIDLFLFHQANGFIINHVVKKIGIDGYKVPLSLENYGNTSSASIPLTACDYVSRNSLKSPINIAMIGFGVGYSWATTILRMNPTVFFPIKEI